MRAAPSYTEHMMALTRLDRWLVAAGAALRTVAASAPSASAGPGMLDAASDMTDADRALSAALMRVNHVGEVCAQALYSAQSLATQDPALRQQFEQAGREEEAHLAWTRERIAELGGRTSLLNPLWYAGAFAIGLAAGRLGDGASLGFLMETEHQVEQHLTSHLDRLPATDQRSRAIVERMRQDEQAHAAMAERAGALPPPAPVRWLMRAAARVMTTTAHHV